MDVNANLCTSCLDNRAGDPVNWRHHHTSIESTIEQVDSFFETHGGPMTACGVDECKRVSAAAWKTSLAKEQEQDERITGVQNDLISQATEIAEWWVKTAQIDAERTAPKAVEYGAADFELMGQMMVALIKDKFVGADDAELMKIGREMACMFYLQGKIGRALGAYQQGMVPSDDTVFDIRVYAVMWERIRQIGYWVK